MKQSEKHFHLYIDVYFRAKTWKNIVIYNNIIVLF